MSDWRCPHGVGAEAKRGDCGICNADLALRPAPETMSGDERAEEVRALLNEPNAYRVADIHERIEELVGRSVWTHEFATDTRLIEEARGALPHPADLRQHIIDTAGTLMDGKPVYVVDVDDDR